MIDHSYLNPNESTVPYSNPVETKYKNEYADFPAVSAVASTTNQADPAALVGRFIKEIRFFSPSPNGNGPQGKSLHGGYEAERLDPNHRFHGSGDKLGKARGLVIDFLSKQEKNASAEAFTVWLKQNHAADSDAILSAIAGLDAKATDDFVQYFDVVNRQKFAIEPGTDGLIYSRKAGGPNAGIEPYDTTSSQAAYGGRSAQAIWVQGPSGRFFSSNESQTGKFHHSSFLAGRDVKAAGDWKVINGRLLEISAISGHYRPPLESLQGALKDLRAVSPQITASAKVLVYEKGNEKTFAPEEFIKLSASALSGYAAVD